MRVQTNEQGISRILLLAGIVLVVALVATGIFLAIKHPSQEKTNQSTDPYLTITEWGVRFPLSVGSRDMYYKLVQYQGGVGEGAKIYSKDFDQLKNANGSACGNEQYPLLVVNRVSASRGQQMNNPQLPEYDPTSGPYKVYDFQTKYAFGTNKDDQTLPPCINLNAGVNRPFRGDKAVFDIFQTKKQTLINGYSQLQAVPAPQSKK